MSKTDELKKEAEEYAEQCYGWTNNDLAFDIAEATYIASAEPREKRIVELEKNLKLWTDTKDARENIFFQQKRKIAELEEENAELKETITKMNNVITETFSNLTKATKLLNEFMRISKASDEVFEHDYSELIGETEQFIKEMEK